MKKYQEELLDKHKDLFEFMIVVCRKSFKMEQITPILIQTKYCRDKVAVSRLFKEFRESDIIHDRKVGSTKLVVIPNPVAKYVMNTNQFQNKVSGIVREQRTAMGIALFKREYLDKGYDIKTSLELMKQDGFNLFTDSQRFYDILNHQKPGVNYSSIAYCSFDNRYSKFFKQQREMKKRLRLKRENMQSTAHSRVKGNKGVSADKKYWILDDLKARSIYFRNMTRNKIVEYDEWIEMNLKPYGIRPYALDFNFIYMTHEWNPNEDTIFKQIMRLYKFIRTSFLFHCVFFLRDKNIKSTVTKININVEVVLMNDMALDKVNQDKIIKKINRVRNKGEYVLDHFKYNLNVSFSHVNLNAYNEHLLNEE